MILNNFNSNINSDNLRDDEEIYITEFKESLKLFSEGIWGSESTDISTIQTNLEKLLAIFYENFRDDKKIGYRDDINLEFLEELPNFFTYKDRLSDSMFLNFILNYICLFI